MRRTAAIERQLSILYSALDVRYGLVVRSNNLKLLKAQLYEIRKEFPEFSRLSFLTSPTAPQTELLILKRETNA